MKYAVLKIVNGAFSIDSEWNENINSAKVKYHDVCKVLWNSSDVSSATVEIIDSQGDVVPGYKEFIIHTSEQ